MKLYKLHLKESQLRVGIEDLQNVSWGVYRGHGHTGTTTFYGSVSEFIKDLGNINTFKDYSNLSYNLRVMRDNFEFLVREKSGPEIEHYVNRLMNDIFLGAWINQSISKDEFHVDDVFEGTDPPFVFIDGVNIYEGRPYHKPDIIGEITPDLKRSLDDVRQVVRNFITKKL